MDNKSTSPECLEGDHRFEAVAAFNSHNLPVVARCAYCGGVAVFDGKTNVFHPMELAMTESPT